MRSSEPVCSCALSAQLGSRALRHRVQSQSPTVDARPLCCLLVVEADLDVVETVDMVGVFVAVVVVVVVMVVTICQHKKSVEVVVDGQ